MESRDEFRARIASIGHIRSGPKPTVNRETGTRTTVVHDDDRGGGRVAGHQIEHADGRVDARVTPPMVKVEGKL